MSIAAVQKGYTQVIFLHKWSWPGLSRCFVTHFYSEKLYLQPKPFEHNVNKILHCPFQKKGVVLGPDIKTFHITQEHHSLTHSWIKILKPEIATFVLGNSTSTVTRSPNTREHIFYARDSDHTSSILYQECIIFNCLTCNDPMESN